MLKAVKSTLLNSNCSGDISFIVCFCCDCFKIWYFSSLFSDKRWKKDKKMYWMSLAWTSNCDYYYYLEPPFCVNLCKNWLILLHALFMLFSSFKLGIQFLESCFFFYNFWRQLIVITFERIQCKVDGANSYVYYYISFIAVNIKNKRSKNIHEMLIQGINIKRTTGNQKWCNKNWKIPRKKIFQILTWLNGESLIRCKKKYLDI